MAPTIDSEAEDLGDGTEAIEELPAEIAEDLNHLGNLPNVDDKGRPVISLPLYGRPWQTGSPLAWVQEINQDPRWRGAAGLGTDLGIREQERLLDAVMRRMGPIREAEQRVRQLALGIESARSLWRRRLPQESRERLWRLGVALPRLMTNKGPLGSIVADPKRPLPIGLFTSAAQRALRLGPARTTLAQPTAARASSLLDSANECPPPYENPSGLLTITPPPLNPETNVELGNVAGIIDPNVAPNPADATVLSRLRTAVESAQYKPGRGGTGRVRWELNFRFPRLVLRWTTGGGQVPPREHRVVINSAVRATRANGVDHVTVKSQEARPSDPSAQYLLQMEVTVGQLSLPTTLDPRSLTGTIRIPSGVTDRSAVVTLTLTHAQTGQSASDSTTIQLAPVDAKIGAQPLIWNAAGRSVRTRFDVALTNLSTESTTIKSSIRSGRTVLARIERELEGGETVGHSTDVDVPTSAAGARGIASLHIDAPAGRFVRPIPARVNLARGEPRGTRLIDLPWLPPLLVAATGSLHGSDEEGVLWDQGMRSWATHVGLHGLDDWKTGLEDTPLEGFTEADYADLLDTLSNREPPPSPQRECRPIPLDALTDVLTDALDPTRPDARPIERVNGTIGGRPPDAGIEPIGLCPDVPIPIWELLREHHEQWILLGLATVAEHAVIGLSTNSRFIEPLLVGINQQLLAEVEYRGLSLNPRCSPCRRFWGRIDTNSGDPLPDIEPIAGWGNTPFVDTSHFFDVDGESLVVLFRSELFRRYPATLVYLIPASPEFTPPPVGELTRVFPSFQGNIGADCTFFGFSEISPSEGRNHWVVIEEPDKGFRFWGNKQGETQTLGEVLDGATGGGQVAAARFANPIRILIRGDEILPEHDTGGEP